LNQRDKKHRLEAMEALGRRLRPDQVVHHWYGEEPTLVICPSQAYHMLLHARQRALEECGNPDLRQCINCREWDFIGNVNVPRQGGGSRHSGCKSPNQRVAHHLRSPK